MIDAKEDMRMIGDPFMDTKGEPLASTQRKRRLSRKKNDFKFTVDHVWTFHFWQHLLDLERFELDVTIKRIALIPILNGQPLRLLARLRNGRILWNFELVHRDLNKSKSEPNKLTNAM